MSRMTADERKTALVALLRESGPAHHHAYIETDGDDPDWPIWYAGYLQERLNALLGTELTKTALIVLLVELDASHRRDDPGAEWPVYYAERILDRYV